MEEFYGLLPSML